MPLKDYCFDGKKTLRIREMPTDAGEYKVQKTDLVIRTEENLTRAAELQERLYAAKQEGLVFALQARDAAGKDSLIKKVFSKLNPAGLKITSFKVPNKTDLAHDYMWRCPSGGRSASSTAAITRMCSSCRCTRCRRITSSRPAA